MLLMRDVLGHFASGVVVVTARAAGGDPTAGAGTLNMDCAEGIGLPPLSTSTRRSIPHVGKTSAMAWRITNTSGSVI